MPLDPSVIIEPGIHGEYSIDLLCESKQAVPVYSNPERAPVVKALSARSLRESWGFEVLPRDSTNGTGAIVSRVNGLHLPPTLKAGMVVESINGDERVSEASFEEINNILETQESGGTLLIRFRSTLEHAIFSKLLDQFEEADEDQSGSLDKEELSLLLRKVLTLTITRTLTLGAFSSLEEGLYVREDIEEVGTNPLWNSWSL